MLAGDAELGDPQEAKHMVPGHSYLLQSSLKLYQRRPCHSPSHPPEKCVGGELDELGPQILHRVSGSEYPERAIDPDGSGEGQGEEGEEGDEDEKGHRMNSVAGLLEQMDH